MDATRYFEGMHQAMSAQSRDFSLLLCVKVQDLGGADAYMELRRNALGQMRVFYSTMGRRNFNFQLFRRGWQLCHNASGELTGQFPASADALLDRADFSSCIRDDALDPARSTFLFQQLKHLPDLLCGTPLQSTHETARITVDSFVGRGGHWCYGSSQADAFLPLSALLCWLGDFLAGAERRTLQSCPEAMALAAQWQAALCAPHTHPAAGYSRPAPQSSARRPAPTAQNPHWQSILAVLATV